jgi:hypothetical protein
MHTQFGEFVPMVGETKWYFDIAASAVLKKGMIWQDDADNFWMENEIQYPERGVRTMN